MLLFWGTLHTSLCESKGGLHVDEYTVYTNTQYIPSTSKNRSNSLNVTLKNKNESKYNMQTHINQL